jgi:hypothetical protein
VKNYTSSERYLKEKGRPVVCIFGLGLVDHAQATVDSSLRFIRSLQANGFYVIGSGPYYWREGTHDALPGYSGVFTAFDAIMPWSVGRYSSALDFSRLGPLVEADAALTQSRGQGYARGTRRSRSRVTPTGIPTKSTSSDAMLGNSSARRLMRT